MCLAIVALDAHPHYRLVVAANRDEFHARAAAPAAWGVAPPFAGILAGRDLEAGGTWLGVRRDGCFALVTNVREPGRHDPGARSRGELVPRVLDAAATPDAVLDVVGALGNRYNGFNLLAGDAAHAHWTSNRFGPGARWARGVHALSNAQLDTPWPKVVRTVARFAAWAQRGERALAPMFAALADRVPAADHELPATGVPLDRERLLSAPFIVDAYYGTRCSTVFTIDRDGAARFHERSFDARGERCGEATEAFALA
jgi:uncharacterized protein with NRDE domain